MCHTFIKRKNMRIKNIFFNCKHNRITKFLKVEDLFLLCWWFVAKAMYQPHGEPVKKFHSCNKLPYVCVNEKYEFITIGFHYITETPLIDTNQGNLICHFYLKWDWSQGKDQAGRPSTKFRFTFNCFQEDKTTAKG